MNKRFCGILFLALSGCASVPKAPDSVQRSFYLMGTQLEMSVEAGTREQALTASEAAFRAVGAAERRLSTWSEDSELARVNAAPVGQAQRLSALLERDLSNAYRCGAETGFAFSPWVGPLVQAWGLRTGGKLPAHATLARAVRASRDDAFSWQGPRLVKRARGALIEEGGFGKGIGLDDALEELRKARVRGAVLDFGGQVAVLGEERAVIEVSDPSVRERTLLRFHAGEGSVSTSGNSEHGMTVRGARVGHLLDPHSGRPAPFDGSVTVYAPTGFEADCLSTALFVMGMSPSMDWARAHAKQALWIAPGGKPGQWVAHVSCGWRPPLERLSDQVEIRRECGAAKEERTL